MPGETFQVLQCYSCHTFQVQQRKQINKWTCKMCGEKQSTKKVYDEGSGADCRVHVQRLNTLRGQIEAARTSSDIDPAETCPDTGEVNTQLSSCSQWTRYIDNKEVCVVEENVSDDNQNWTTDAKMYKNSLKQNRKRRKSQSQPYESRRQNGNGRGFATFKELVSRNLNDDDIQQVPPSPRPHLPQSISTSTRESKWGTFVGDGADADSSEDSSVGDGAIPSASGVQRCSPPLAPHTQQGNHLQSRAEDRPSQFGNPGRHHLALCKPGNGNIFTLGDVDDLDLELNF